MLKWRLRRRPNDTNRTKITRKAGSIESQALQRNEMPPVQYFGASTFVLFFIRSAWQAVVSAKAPREGPAVDRLSWLPLPRSQRPILKNLLRTNDDVAFRLLGSKWRCPKRSWSDIDDKIVFQCLCVINVPEKKME